MNQYRNGTERQPNTGARTDLPAGVGSKFNADGSVRRFPGNTIICHLSPDSALYRAMLDLYDKLVRSEFAPLYTLLPPTSWHMTVFEGVCDQVRQPDFWPDGLGLEAPLSECNDVFENCLASFELDCAVPFELEIRGWRPMKTGLGLNLQPATPAMEAQLRRLRDRLSAALGIRHPDHDSYVFHMSMAYMIRNPARNELAELSRWLTDQLSLLPSRFTLGAPEFCHFEDMFAFDRKVVLGDPCLRRST